MIVTCYMAAMVAIGFLTRRPASNQEEFLVACRSVGPLLYSGILAAIIIIIGGGATMAGVKLDYTASPASSYKLSRLEPVRYCESKI